MICLKVSMKKFKSIKTSHIDIYYAINPINGKSRACDKSYLV